MTGLYLGASALALCGICLWRLRDPHGPLVRAARMLYEARLRHLGMGLEYAHTLNGRHDAGEEVGT